MDEVFLAILLLVDATIRVATPLVLAAFAALYGERAGVVDIGLEGKMLAGAFFAAAVASSTGNPWLGLLAGIAASVALSLVHGFACITHNGNQVVSGMAINILVAGLAPTLAYAWFHQGGQTPLLPSSARLPQVHLPGVEVLSPIPVIGPIYREIFDDANVLIWLTVLVVIATHWVLTRTRFGLRLRAVGESPAAVDTAGISVTKLRYQAVIITGVLTGVAGAYLSTAHGAGFVRDMTAGKGYLALAALIFGKWRPWPTLFACLLFAFTDAVQVRLQGVPLPVVGVIPVQFIQMLPYVLTVLLLAGFVGKAVAPKASGIPYVKER
ncbi:ABC transporter permease [Azospirillum rugosum]|uniref:Simple sugar transport system permease protein n=1 Tax=Azospirillum rugosum TaxID=416170 RepID=A0ABS4SM33_9PROT|nr:ABC transporter permease [Azospirillum rugosum]MBP2293585.1 simple sugar transport system permease protein [Azospirillum rugosum]MDQ0529264.1 simple sugar transport system permease protein [Azospirillum rugosum]